ncbi:MAG: S-methyl-5'-thioadenosine phosphorylase [Candidatus Magasanikbacteria bacterium]|nr:S-methyl-5'-thioadenosine phosphorylase [Candidatus Magasanikbacteria bacterium]
MLGIIGGSGFYKLLDQVEEKNVNTPFGAPSAPIAVGEYQCKKVAFLPRHGLAHGLPPHKINYRANLWALKQLGVDRVLAPCAVGSLQPHIKPGEFVIIDQFIDRTWGRADTFCEGAASAGFGGNFGRVAHPSPAHPYCPDLSKLAADSCRQLGIAVHDKSTVVVINGPRFSTKAESRWFSSHGWEIINMTQYPEAMLAREMEMCFCGIALVTDYDAGLEGHPEVAAVDAGSVLEVFKQNNEKLGKLLFEIIAKLPETKNCLCGEAMKNAFV